MLGLEGGSRVLCFAGVGLVRTQGFWLQVRRPHNNGYRYRAFFGTSMAWLKSKTAGSLLGFAVGYSVLAAVVEYCVKFDDV